MATFKRLRAAVAAAPPVTPSGALTLQVDTGGVLPLTLDPVMSAPAEAGIILPSIAR